MRNTKEDRPVLPRAEALAAEYIMLPRGAVVLCALSGGADSVCLLHWLSRQPDIILRAAHFNHQLRSTESDGDESFVRQLCQQLDVPLTVGSADVAAAAQVSGRGIEETARRLRYDFLEQTADVLGCDCIATAHNADDNAETLLLHLVRGTGLQGLTGIPPRRDRLIRPLLTTSRAEILAYLDAEGLPHREDSSNADERYSRNKIRAQVMPVLRELNPRLTESVSAALHNLRSDNDCLNSQAAQVCANARWSEDGLVLPARCLAELHPALANRAARRLLELAGGSADCTAAHLRSIVDLARGNDPSGRLSLPHGLLARRVYGSLVLTTVSGTPPSLRETPLNFDGITAPENCPWRCSCRPCICPKAPELGVFYLRRDALAPDAALTPRRVGDALAIAGRAGTKTIKKWLIDAKVPRWTREQLPVLRDGSGVAALAGFGPETSRSARAGEDAWAIHFEKL